MSWPTLQQLRYIVAIADTGSFGAAADEEHVSQPALSAQVKEAERRLGAVLFERTARGVILTTEGEAVVRRARLMLRDMEDLVREAQSDGTTLRGRVEFAVIPTLAPYVLADIVRIFASTHPQARLHIREVQTDELLSDLRDGRIDVGLLALPVEGTDLDVASVGVDEFVLAVPNRHRLARKDAKISIGSVASERVILLEEGHCLRDQVVDACRLPFSEPEEIQATSMPALVQMVASGLGVTLLPRCAVQVEAAKGRGIVVKEFTGHAPSRTVGFVWRKSSPHARVYCEFADVVSGEKLFGKK